MPSGPNSSNCVEIGSVDFAVGVSEENLRRKDTNTIIQQFESSQSQLQHNPELSYFGGWNLWPYASQRGISQILDFTGDDVGEGVNCGQLLLRILVVPLAPSGRLRFSDHGSGSRYRDLNIDSRHRVLEPSEPTSRCHPNEFSLVTVQLKSIHRHPSFKFINATRYGCGKGCHLIWCAMEIDLSVICVTVARETMLTDNVHYWRGVKNEQQGTQYGSLGYSRTQFWCRRTAASNPNNLSPIRQIRFHPLQHQALQSKRYFQPR